MQLLCKGKDTDCVNRYLDKNRSLGVETQPMYYSLMFFVLSCSFHQVAWIVLYIITSVMSSHKPRVKQQTLGKEKSDCISTTTERWTTQTSC